MNKDVLYRIITIAIGVTFPLIMMHFFPDKKSLSAFWETPMVALFILMNVITASFFYTLEKWRIPAILLILTTALPVTYFGQIHNILAVAFFITAGYAVLTSKRYSWLAIFLIPAIIVSFKSLLLAEIIAIDVISIYHGMVLWKREKINKKRLDNI